MARTHIVCVAGGLRYKQFANELMKSAAQCFRPGGEVLYHILDGIEGWPNGTLFRYHCLLRQLSGKVKPGEHVFLCDADMRFEMRVTNDILSEGLTATLHPGFVSKMRYQFPYEDREQSAAYVGPEEGKFYFAGGFVGGSADAFWELATEIALGIENDLGMGLIAKWHDESHLNRYLASHPPQVVLDPSYCFPDNDTYYKKYIWGELRYERRLVALDKTKEERGER